MTPVSMLTPLLGVRPVMVGRRALLVPLEARRTASQAVERRVVKADREQQGLVAAERARVRAPLLVDLLAVAGALVGPQLAGLPLVGSARRRARHHRQVVWARAAHLHPVGEGTPGGVGELFRTSESTR